MTIDELIDEAAKLGPWYVTRGSQLIRRGGSIDKIECPVVAVANAKLGKSWPSSRYDEAALAIGLSTTDAADIVIASDIAQPALESRSALRQQLLERLVRIN